MTASGAVVESPSLGRSARNVLGGAALLASAQIGSRLLTMLFTLVIARLMSVEAFGSLNLALSTVVVVALIQDLGLSRTVVKEIARRPEDAGTWIGALVPVKLALAVVAAVATPLIFAALGFSTGSVAVIAAASAMLPSAAVWLLLENATQAVGATRLLAGITLLNAAIQTVLGLAVAVLADGSPAVLAAALAAANLLSTCVLWKLLSARVQGIRPRIDPIFARRAIVASLPYLGVAVGVAALGRIELLMVGRLAGEAEAGTFAAAFKIFEAALFVVYAIQIAMNPVMAKLVSGARDGLDRWIDWELAVVAAAIVPAGVAAYLLAGPVIGLLYPPAYAPAGTVLAVLLGVMPVVAVQVFTAGALMLTDRQGAMFVVNVVVIAAQFVLAALFIPRLGALGAAVSLAISQALAAAIGLALLGRWLVNAGAFAGAARALVAGMVAVAVGGAALAAGGPTIGIATALIVLALALTRARLRLLPPG